MKNAGTIIALIVAIIFLAALSVGCEFTGGSGQSAETGTAAAASAPAENRSSGPMEISIAQWGIEEDFPADKPDTVYDTIKNKFNIKIKPVNTTWDDYAQKIQIWAASRQLPDVFVIDAINQPYQKTWIKEGLVKELPADLSKYPNIQKLLEPKDFQAYKASDGKFYCLPKPTYTEEYEYGCEKGLYYRKDWMANVGIAKIPENTDEFITLMKAFVQQDPDKNGRDDTIGLTAYGTSHFLDIMLSYMPGLSGGNNQWIREDGRWIPSLLSKKALPGIKELKRIYNNGCVDKDIVLDKGEEGLDKFASGHAGALAYGGTPGFQKRVKDKFYKSYPEKDYKDCILLTHYWKAPDGNYYRYTAPRPWSENYFNANTVDDRKMERIMSLCNWLLSDEGLTLVRYGIEGRDYAKQRDNIVLTRPKTEKGDDYESIYSLYPSTRAFTWLVTWDTDFDFLNPSYTPHMRKMSEDIRAWCKNEAIAVPTDFRLEYLEFPSRGKVVINTVDDIYKIIMGSDPDKIYHDIIQGYYDQGLQQMIDDLNKASVEAGIQ